MDASQTPQLNPLELYDKRKSKDVGRLRAYNKILEQIYNRVRVMSKLPTSQCYLLYTVPQFIFGLPKLDLEDMIVYLIYQLRHAGYEIRYTPPNMLYISWAHHERSYLVEKSPIMQAMLESAEKTQAEIERKEKEAARLLVGKKSQQKVKMNVPGQMQRPSQPFGQKPSVHWGPSQPPRSAISTVLNRAPSAGPPPPSAADYVPPSAFLQTMSQPKNTVVQPRSVQDYFS
jgi:hypothetical protein